MKGSLESLIPNAHVAAGILKHYLSSLPEPILISNLNQTAVEVVSRLHDTKGQAFDSVEVYFHIQFLVNQLPDTNRSIISYLISFFNRLIRRSPPLKSVIIETFGPMLFRSHKPVNIRKSTKVPDQSSNSAGKTILKVLLQSFSLHIARIGTVAGGGGGGEGGGPAPMDSILSPRRPDNQKTTEEGKGSSLSSTSASSSSASGKTVAINCPQSHDSGSSSDEDDEEFSNMIPIRITNLTITNLIRNHPTPFPLFFLLETIFS